jgi:hypothetical protein
MKALITIELDQDRVPELLKFLNGSPCQCAEKAEAHPMMEMQDAPEASAEKPKRTRRTKAEVAAARAPEEEPAAPAVEAAAPTQEVAPAPDAEAPSVTLAELRAIMNQYASDHGQDKAKALIAAVGKAPKLVDMDPVNYAALYEAAQKAA